MRNQGRSGAGRWGAAGMAGTGSRAGYDRGIGPPGPYPCAAGTVFWPVVGAVAPDWGVLVRGDSSTSSPRWGQRVPGSPRQGRAAVPGARPLRWLPPVRGKGREMLISPGAVALRDLVVELPRIPLEAAAGLLTQRVACRGEGESCQLQCHVSPAPPTPPLPPWSLPPAPACPRPLCCVPGWLPMWQLCTQMRCPSYLQLHFMALLVKSLSATSKLGLITTCGQVAVRVAAPDPHPAAPQPRALSAQPFLLGGAAACGTAPSTTGPAAAGGAVAAGCNM